MYPVEHVHVQPSTTLPVTLEAWELQFHAIVHGVSAKFSNLIFAVV